MKIVYLTIIVLVYSCSNDKTENRQNDILINKKTKESKEKINQFDALKEKVISHQKEEVKKSIICDEFNYNKLKINDYDLSLENYNYISDSENNKIESLIINHYNDTILDLSMFKNLKRIKVFNCRNLSISSKVLNRLRVLEMWISDLYLLKSQKSLSQLKALHLDKSFIYTEDTLSLKRIKYLYFAYSGVKKGNINFNDFIEIQELTLRAYHKNGEKINLREINLNNLPCLNKLIVDDQLGCLTGLPQNLVDRTWKKLKIHNRDVSEKEHLIIKELGL